ncbi:hypothetical protein [Moorena sp. SIO3H5]|nr:hypothetical protein [Moorena sp. SIO3H5]NEO73491.1 hypothetical protein [Moorena sp. SIO3H5]
MQRYTLLTLASCPTIAGSPHLLISSSPHLLISPSPHPPHTRDLVNLSV